MCQYHLYQQDYIEEEDADAIERVLWHQPKGMAEEAAMANKSTQPVLLSHLFDTEPDWNEMEFLIKWKGQSHLHCQWKPLAELQNVSMEFIICVPNFFIFCRLFQILYLVMLIVYLLKRIIVAWVAFFSFSNIDYLSLFFFCTAQWF